MNDMPVEQFEDQMMMALEGDINDEARQSLEGYFDMHPDARVLFAQMQANDAALLTLPLPSVPTSLTLNVMNAIHSPQILASVSAKQAAKPATLPPTWVWQLAFLLGLMGVLVVVAVGVLVSASPTLRFMLIALERAEVNTFLAFLRSLSSFFFGLFGLMGAIAAVTRTLLRQPSAWAGLLAGIAIVVAWVSAMVAIYRPMPKSAGFTPTSL
ncbi:MAG: hypothetical protein WCL57_06655 [Chloroflexota bacterium]|jgi:hypothetical protein|nr:hypothetical protein [Chloroflexota bacterium]